MTERLSRILHAAVLDWYKERARDLPWRLTRDPYAILVSEVMLQQTQAERVAPKFAEFLARFPTFEALAQAPTADVIRAWAPLGYNRRAVRLQRIAQAIGDGQLPEDPAALRRLDGVGEYTAAAVACFAFGAQVPVVDTNVRRVLRRCFGMSAATESEVRGLAKQMLPEGAAYPWNQALMDLGATVCLSKAPRCHACPLRTHCPGPSATPPIAEAKAVYRAEPFAGSRRYYRGRIVDRLRHVADGRSLSLEQLGNSIKDGFSGEELDWLEDLVDGLARDGLVKRVAMSDLGGTVALP